MSELLSNNRNDYEEEPPSYVRLEMPDGEMYECTPENTLIFTHAQEPEYDCLAFKEEEDENGGVTGQVFWREGVNHFDEIIDWMSSHDFQFVKTEFATDEEKEIHTSFKRAQEAFATVADYDPDIHLTSHQKRQVKFLSYLLENEMILPKNFKNKNEDEKS